MLRMFQLFKQIKLIVQLYIFQSMFYLSLYILFSLVQKFIKNIDNNNSDNKFK